MKSPMWSFGIPPDASAWVALVLGLSCVAVAWWRGSPRVLERLESPRAALLLVVALGAAAALGSVLYVNVYLGGGPRIIDATSYFLEARMLSEGSFSFEPITPAASFRGRFLTGPETGEALGVIFPPGYPLLLALGFLLQKPMWMGPLMAFCMVLVSYGLALRLFGRRDVALLAAALSTVCATLRYHTADTMSHGWAALLLALALYACTFERRGFTLIAGLAAGWLLATRPLTGALAVILSAGWLLHNQRRQWWLLALGTLPGIALFLAHQRAVTGSWLASAQLHYYALADGPPGCFSYGFGDQVGCRHEHAQFVAERLQDGFGLWEALRTTLHRVHWHTLDLANFEPLWIVMLYAAIRGRKHPAVRVLAFAVCGIVLLYLPFYFNGSYPGGGARFLMDTIAFEHVLLAWGAMQLGLARWVLPAALLGYAVHGVFGHQALAEREGGRPMFEPERIAQLDSGLVLIDSDHGFNLAFDPASRDARQGVVVARHRADAHDDTLWRSLGRPTAYRYRFDFWKPQARPTLTKLAMPRSQQSQRYEAESIWPPRTLTGGWAEPKFLDASCASHGRGLDLNPTPGSTLRLELDLYSPDSKAYDLVVGWVKRSHHRTTVGVRTGSLEQRLALEPNAPDCPVLMLTQLPVGGGRVPLTVLVEGGRANLDFAELRLRDSSTTVNGGSEGNSVDN